MTIYDNLLALIKQDAKLHHQWYYYFRLGQLPNGDVELYGYRGWNRTRDKTLVTISAGNIATYHIDRYDITLNLVLGQLGLGAIARNRTVQAKLLFCYNARRFLYTPGMQVDLNTGDIVGDALAFDELMVDKKARFALLKTIRSKIPQAASFLRVSGMTYQALAKVNGADNATPEDFVDAVREDKTQLIAAIPLRNLHYCTARNEIGTSQLCTQYGAALKAYINQNRSLIYQAGGVIKSDRQGALV